ncbi:MAG: endo-1,4-beta-xylanase, partial [Myxococcota bacterium]
RGDGDYGALDLYDRNFTRLTHIRVNSGVGATFDRINLTRCSNLRLTRVRVRPKTRTTAVYINGGHRVEIYSSDIAFAETSHDWTQNDWNSKTESGIRTTPSGTNHRFLYNTIHSVRHGIEIWSDSTLARHNHINQFNGRAIRIFANQAKVYDNLITNNQHTDGATVAIQSMTRSASGTYGGGVLTGVHVRGNLIVESTYPNKRFPGMLQGIAFFDGIYKNYRIHHNVVVVDHWHGISLHGSEGSSIYQNTVVDARPGTGGKPWIQVGNHKNGTVNSATRVYRNVTASLNPIGAVDSYDNEIVGSSAYENHFRDPVNHDWRSAVPSQRGASMGRLFMSDTLMGVGARSSVALGTSMSRQTCHLSPSDPLCDGVLSDLDMFTLGNPLKWGALRRVEGQYNFADADRMLDFAAGNGLSVHGHTLVWTVDNPAWLEAYRGNSTAL